MNTFAPKADERVNTVYFGKGTLVVELMDGRTISVPIYWYPRLLKASSKQRANWKISGAGYGIHWPEIDEDLSTEGLLRGAPAPGALRHRAITRRPTKRKISPRRKSQVRARPKIKVK